jgi:hypothetical protein
MTGGEVSLCRLWGQNWINEETSRQHTSPDWGLRYQQTMASESKSFPLTAIVPHHSPRFHSLFSTFGQQQRQSALAAMVRGQYAPCIQSSHQFAVTNKFSQHFSYISHTFGIVLTCTSTHSGRHLDSFLPVHIFLGTQCTVLKLPPRSSRMA